MLVLRGPVRPSSKNYFRESAKQKAEARLPCLLHSLLVWTVEGGSEEAQNREYSKELGSILNQRMLARRAQDIVPATFFSAVEFLLTHGMALLARVSPCLSNQSWEVEGMQHRLRQQERLHQLGPQYSPLFMPMITGRQH